MKKLLSILGAVSLTTTGISGVVANKLYQTNVLKSGWKKILDVRMFHQLTNWYCGPASVQMILNYFNVDPTVFTQDRIYQDLGGIGEEGIAPNREIATYLNNVRAQHGETRGLNYSFEYLPSGFGTEENEMLMFQDYIVQSLSNNAPIMFAYDSGYERHACVINGIQVDENEPGRTSYNFLEPNFGTRETMTGWDIRNYITNSGNGAALFGVSDNFDFKNKRIKTEVKEDTHTRNRLYSGDDVQINTNLNLDLATVGIISHNQLNKANSITFPDLTLNENWNGKEENYSGDSWNAKNITGNQEWVEWKAWEYYHEYWFAKAKLWWWDSTKIIEETSNDFIIAFQYYLGCTTLGSGSSIDVTLDYGKVAYINF